MKKEKQLSRKGLAIWIGAAVLLLAVCLVLIGVSGDGENFPVYISEILASNVSFPNADGRCADFIELHNSADYPVDLTGYQLGDIAGSTRYAFPSGTVIQPDGYLVVWCDKAVEGYAPFGVSRSGGESFYLIAANSAIVDSVVTLATDPDQSMIRNKNKPWSYSASVTPGYANGEAATGSDTYNAQVSPVRISEFSSAGNGYAREQGIRCDWVELYNTGSQSVDISGFSLSDNAGNDKYIFPQGTVLTPGGYHVVYCSDRVTGLAPFNLSQTTEEPVVLKNAGGMIVEIVRSMPLEQGAQALQADGSWSVTQEPTPGFENSATGTAAFMASIGANDIQITEVMASQDALLPDGYGAFSDYVELYNAGSKEIDLTGWCLSDDSATPDKWIFPSTTIEPGQYLLVFCSGNDGIVNDKLHADFSLSADGESLVLSTWLGTAVDQVTFGAAETNRPFDGDGNLLEQPSPGFENAQTGYEQFCAAHIAPGPLAIWEVMTSNDTYLPQALGQCYDWVELRNTSDSEINLSGYSLTDDPDSPGLFQLPDVTLKPGECYCLFLSGNTALGKTHAPFALNAAKDRLLLYTADGQLLDYVFLSDIPPGYSYGRSEQSGGFAYMEPSPKNPNKAGYRTISAMPTSGYAPGVYSGNSFTLSLEAKGSIYYTTDGSEPTAKSKAYTGPLPVDKTMVVRAISIEEEKMPSSIYTATFIIGDQHDLPVVSLVTDPSYLWGANGVYKNGDESVKEIHFPANVAYAGDDGNFSIDNEMSLHGVTTVIAFNKKSFTLRFKDNLDGPLYYDVFEDGEVTTYRSLLLRTAHESTYSSQMHDTLMSEIAQQGGDTLVVQKYKYVALYLNGDYWGLYAIREQHTTVHYASYYNVPVDTVSMVRYTSDEQNNLNKLYKFCQNNSLASAKNYEYAKTVLDMESFADWIIFQAYIRNIDIYENIRYYQSSLDGIWHLALSDLDMGMMSTGSGFEEMSETFHHGRLVRSMLQNKDFQALLAQRMAYWLSGPMSDENMLATIDKMAATIRAEAAWEEQKWGTPVSGWEAMVNDMKRYCTGRAQFMINDLCAYLNWSRDEARVYFGDLME